MSQTQPETPFGRTPAVRKPSPATGPGEIAVANGEMTRANGRIAMASGEIAVAHGGAGQASGDGAVVNGLVPAATVRTQVTVPLRFADGYAATARVFSFHGLVDGREHLALGLGDWRGSPDRYADGGPAPLVRPHSECLTGDVLGSQRCDCGPQLREAVERIAGAGGLLLYLRQEGRGIGLYAKLDAYALQDTGLDTYQANLALGHAEDERDYTAAAQMLHALGARRVALLTNNPDKAEQLGRLGVEVTERIPTAVHLSNANIRYLAAKANHTSHTIDLPRID